jgi:hypothetical protein
MRLSLAVFALVTLGTVSVVAFANRELSGSALGGNDRLATGIIAAVVVAVVALGYWQARFYMGAARSRRIQMATGPAAVTDDDDHVRIGPTRLRLAGEEQRGAFAPGSEYRVYYLAGPVPIVLSAQAVGVDPAPDADEAVPSVADETVVFKRGYVIVLLLGALAVGIPLAGIAAGRLPPGLSAVAWIGLLALAIGFAWFAVRWLTHPPGGEDLTPGGRRRGRGPGR